MESGWSTPLEPAKRSDVLNPIRNILEKEMKVPQDPPKPLVNLGLGEPSKANGFTLPEVINDSVIEIVKQGDRNGYTTSSGAIEAKQAIVDK